MNELTEGQTVMILPYGYEYGSGSRTRRGNPTTTHEGTIVKIGRTRVTISVRGANAQFDITTRRECVRDYGRRFETEEDFAARSVRLELIDRIAAAGLSFNSTGRRDLMSIEKLTTIAIAAEMDD